MNAWLCEFRWKEWNRSKWFLLLLLLWFLKNKNKNHEYFGWLVGLEVVMDG